MPKSTTATARAVTAAKATAKPATKRAKAAPVTAATAPTIDKAAARAAFAATVAADRKQAATTHGTFDPASVSIPVKSFAAFKRSYKRDVTAHAIGRKPSQRQAAALTFACLAASKPIADKATFARRFTHNGHEFAIENGALSDAIASGLCTYNGPADTVTIANAAEIQSQIGTFAKLA